MTTDPALKAQLVIKLLAGDVEVAESTDPALWQMVLRQITSGVDARVTAEPHLTQTLKSGPTASSDGLVDPGVERFAAEVGVTVDEAVGAFGLTASSPYIHLDARTWEAFRRNFPSRGPGAIAPIALAATALIFWFRAGTVGRHPRMVEANAVLDTIHLRDKNPTRGVQNCDWLQSRNGELILNPAFVSRAAATLRAYARREGPAGGNSNS